LGEFSHGSQLNHESPLKEITGKPDQFVVTTMKSIVRTHIVRISEHFNYMSN